MLELREVNLKDIDKEYEYFTNLLENENGFTNKYYGISKAEFYNKIIYKLINNGKGIDLEEGRVSMSSYLLWEDDNIVGLFRIRHYLNDALRNGAGHIGYGIKKEYRGKGYATIGLKLAVEKARNIIKEDEIYMSVDKNNLASLNAQLKNGAYIHHEDEKEYYTRIKL